MSRFSRRAIDCRVTIFRKFKVRGRRQTLAAANYCRFTAAVAAVDDGISFPRNTSRPPRLFFCHVDDTSGIDRGNVFGNDLRLPELAVDVRNTEKLVADFDPPLERDRRDQKPHEASDSYFCQE